MTFGYSAPPGGGDSTDMIVYYYDCMVCGLKDEHHVTNEMVNQLTTIESRRVRRIAAWKHWFHYWLAKIMDDGEYPRWLETGRPQSVANPNPITEWDF